MFTNIAVRCETRPTLFLRHGKLQNEVSKREVWREIMDAFRSYDYWDIACLKLRILEQVSLSHRRLSSGLFIWDNVYVGLCMYEGLRVYVCMCVDWCVGVWVLGVYSRQCVLGSKRLGLRSRRRFAPHRVHVPSSYYYYYCYYFLSPSIVKIPRVKN